MRRLERWLDSYLNFERLTQSQRTSQKNIFWLDTMEFLCAVFGNPQNHGYSIHVAGSKGKGSVSAMLNAILRHAGFSCGLYTSPHVLDFSERVTQGNAPYSDALYADVADELISGVERIPPEDFPGGRPVTWFELVTLFAFLVFRKANVDWAVYETGLGGRLDATNVLNPALSVITNIELEHTEYLGDTLEAIAAEKGGIIKPNVPVFIAPQAPAVRTVYERIAAEKGAELTFADDALRSLETHTARDGERVVIDSPLFARPVTSTLKLYGAFQAQNAALAALAAKKLFPVLDEAIIEAGLADASLPGRFQIIDNPFNAPAKDGGSNASRSFGNAETTSAWTRPALVLDGAHTVTSVSQSVQTFEALFVQPGALVFACARDKDVEHIAPLFSGFRPITLTRPGTGKEPDVERLRAAFKSAGLAFRYDDDYTRAITNALQDASNAGQSVLVTGSFYLVAEIMRILENEAK
jgi:dihydrofolate synthase/folylpolyglutamate synthase